MSTVRWPRLYSRCDGVLVGSSNSPVDSHTGDRMIQKEEFDDFVKELIGV